MKKTLYFGLGSLAMLAVLVTGIFAANAANDPEKTNTNTNTNRARPYHMMGGAGMMQGQGPFADENDAVQTAMDNNDYSAWKTAIEDRAQEVQKQMTSILDNVNESNFSQFVEMHNLMKSGDREGAQAIADELGIEQPMFGKGPMGDRGHRGEMNLLDENSTYDAWKSAVEARDAESGHTSPMLDIITADNFDQFKQMHELMQSGDREGAQAVAEELGLERPAPDQGFHRGQGMGQRKGQMAQDQGQTQQ